MNKDEQILKSRDDKSPVLLQRKPEGEGIPESFTVAEGSQCSWIQTKDESFDSAKLRERIEPWLTALFQSEHFAVLVGSGLTHAVHHLATGESLPGMSTVTVSEFGKEKNAAAKKSAEAAGRKNGNIEDQLRVAGELLRGLEIISETEPKGANGLGKKRAVLEGELTGMLKSFAESVLKGENGLITAKEKDREKAFSR